MKIILVLVPFMFVSCASLLPSERSQQAATKAAAEINANQTVKTVEKTNTAKPYAVEIIIKRKKQ